MRLKDSFLAALINILLGVAWAFALIGALSSFITHYSSGIFYGIASAIVWMIPGLFAVLVLEYLLSGFARLEEAQKHTRLLEELVKQKKREEERS